MNILRILFNYKSYIVIVVVPLLLLPILFYIDGEYKLMGRCAYMMALMGLYWVTEAIPLAATGLIPIFMAPMFGLLNGNQVAANYMKNITLMLSGGVFVAIAVERSMLHKRIALAVLRVMGTTPKWLLLGFMLPTFICSMFISNTATTAMMMPIMEAVLGQLRDTPGGIDNTKEAKSDDGEDNQALDMSDVVVEEKSNGVIMDTTKSSNESADENTLSRQADQESRDLSEQEESEYFKKIARGMTLGICYAANVGGTATLTGTNPNLILKGQADIIWQAEGYSESPVTYSTWIPYGLPGALMNFVLLYCWLVLFHLGIKAFVCSKKDSNEHSEAVKAVIKKQYDDLGSISYAEVAVAFLFTVLVFLWFFRSPGFMDGWASYFEEGYVSDAVPALLIATVLFCTPMTLPWQETAQKKEPVPGLLIWEDIHDKFPWGILFLMGGGFCLAQAAQVSGLSLWIGEQLAWFENLNDWLMIGLICFLVAMLTEVTSNSATCTILMPIMGALAEAMGRNPLYLMLPTAVSTSYAFMLPVATPPNAIAFSYGRLTVLNMICAGAILNFLCVFVVTLATQTWGYTLFDLGDIPWANDTKAVASVMNDTII